jgi:hypothetical protein
MRYQGRFSKEVAELPLVIRLFRLFLPGILGAVTVHGGLALSFHDGTVAVGLA